MKVTLHMELEVNFFQLEEIESAEALAEREGGTIYTWKTVGKENWLEHGARNVDALGLVVLPSSLPDLINMCDDVIEEE